MCTFLLGDIMDLKYMDFAFKEAEKAFECGEVPVGAVIVKDNKIIAKAYNKKERSCCATEHAEILAIKKASKNLKNWRLENCDIYVTLEPCPMCASAIKQSRIKNVYSALQNRDKNNFVLIKSIFECDNVNPSVNFINNLSVEKSEQLLQNFFSNRRNL